MEAIRNDGQLPDVGFHRERNPQVTPGSRRL